MPRYSNGGMKKLFFTLIAALALCGAFTAFAESFDYSVSNAEFEDQTETGRAALLGVWDRSEDRTAYTVRLYKGTKRIYASVTGGTKIDFSSAICSKAGGAGKYCFTVTPNKGTEDMTVTSETIEVTAQMVTAVRNRISAERKAAIAAAGGGWRKGPGDIWIYYSATGDQVKANWVDDGGYRYYFDKNGIMLTGWQAVGSAYYYFEPKGTGEHPLGSLWVGTTTPDGHTVDETGARLGDDGKAETAVSLKQLSAVQISLKETQNPGEYTRIENIVCGSGTVENVTYATDPSTWTSSMAGAVVFEVKLAAGNKLKRDLKLTCSRASSITLLGRTEDTLRIELHYIPKYVLKEPSNFTISSDWVLRWDKVPKAGGYTVKATLQEQLEDGDIKTNTKTFTVTENSIFLPDCDITEDTDIRAIQVAASGTSRKLMIDSSAAKIEDFGAFVAENTVDGEFHRSSSGLKYTDESGEEAAGWTEIAGSWYYFRENGYAAGPGWWQDADRNWYYFDESNRMMTGDVTVDGTVYHLNTDPDAGLPLGAWIE